MMATAWQRVAALEGKRLWTVRNHPFTIESIDQEKGTITFYPESSGKRRHTERWRIEMAERLGFVRDDVTPIELRHAKVSEFNPAYLTAILRAISKIY